ncbi:response regulator transcription factor [Ferroacidibacillus organovorans]|uniref:DNA-binding response regulator n=1 Tax=Ferroacidibacillus organovorans TaxID=1765683 RepID=A0A162U0T0_9BACL|nr:response regulator transcription factor [Ferroacidibacillus organovorans]KYP81309.1 hypothetical protein AYJ22_07840 [Ferroacidibacillus organovorans]OAG95294.1 hypothetical protein AYW79_01090 [Ferroacidibacillus organovorans]OPG17162.1 DNA-binding response regulator [Ferroacidibacillus organovorans]
MANVLIVEDEPKTAEILRLFLEQNGHTCSISHDGHAGLGRALTESYDVLLLDQMLPGIDGLKICQTVKSQRVVYVILITAKAGEQDRIDGLERGADDYVVKPFSLRELLARVNRLVMERERRSETSENINSLIRVGNCLLETSALSLRSGIHEVILTVTESQMLELLFSRFGAVCSKVELANAAGLIASGESLDDATSHKVTSHMSHLRKKLAQIDSLCFLKTIHSVGYKIVCLTSEDRN